MTSIDLNEARFQYALRMGDDRLILSHRLSEWCGHGPILEEDMALSNIALDLLGQANELLNYAGEIEGKGRDSDAIAHSRIEPQYTNIKMVERLNGNFADTIARQFLWDVFDYHFCNLLQNSKDEMFAAIAVKSLKEVTYHVRHSKNWILKLGDGTQESHDKLQAAVNDVWIFTGEMFEMDGVDELLLKEGIGVDLAEVKKLWDSTVKDIFTEATIQKPEDGWMQSGARKGQHTEALGMILAEMQYLQRAYPGAKW